MTQYQFHGSISFHFLRVMQENATKSIKFSCGGWLRKQTPIWLGRFKKIFGIIFFAAGELSLYSHKITSNYLNKNINIRKLNYGESPFNSNLPMSRTRRPNVADDRTIYLTKRKNKPHPETHIWMNASSAEIVGAVQWEWEQNNSS